MNFQMTIGKRFVIAAAAVLSLMIVLGVFALSLTSSVAKLVNTVVTDPLPGVYEVSKVEIALQQLRGDAWKHMGLSDAGQKSGAEQDIQDLKLSMDRTLADYEKTIVTPEDREAFEKAPPAISRYVQAVVTDVLPLSRDQKLNEAREKYMSECDPLHHAALAAVANLVDLNRRNWRGRRGPGAQQRIQWKNLDSGDFAGRGRRWRCACILHGSKHQSGSDERGYGVGAGG
jgi:hypothetical protein